MTSKKIVSLNRELNDLLARLQEDNNSDSKKLLPKALELCGNDAETQHVIRSMKKMVIASVRESRDAGQAAWEMLDVLFQWFDISIPKPPEMNSTKPGSITPEKNDTKITNEQEIAFKNALNSVGELKKWEEVQRAKHAEKGLIHVPFGHSELFEILSESGIKHDFQRELDDHLKRLLPLYVEKPDSRAPVSTQETVLVVRDLFCSILDEIESAILESDRDTLIERGIDNEFLRDSDDASANLVEVVCAYARAMSAANTLAFDLLYRTDQSAQESCLEFSESIKDNRVASSALIDFSGKLIKEIESNNTSKDQTENKLNVSKSPSPEMISEIVRAWIFSILFEFTTHEDNCDSFGNANEVLMSIAERAGLLVPGLRKDLLSKTIESPWKDNKIDPHYNSSFYWTLRKNKPVAETLYDFTLNLASSGLISKNFINPISSNIVVDKKIMGLLGLTIREPTLNDILPGWDTVAWMFYDKFREFPDGSIPDDDLEDGENYLALRTIVYEKIKSSPRTSEKIQCWHEGFENLNKTTDWLLHVILPDLNSPSPPAIFHISRYFSEISDAEWSYKTFLLAFNACIEENLYGTAARLLNYFITNNISFRSVKKYAASGHDPNVQNFLRLEGISSAIRRLDGKAPLAPTREAVTVALNLYRMINEIEEDDYFTEGLASLIDWMNERISGPVPSEGQAVRLHQSYEARLMRLSLGNSGRWPENIRRHVISIETEHDLNVGNKPDHSLPDDYPWVVSYHKIIESLLRQKLQFMLKEPVQSFLSVANKNEKIRGFEPYKVFRLIERADAQPNKYEVVISEMKARGIHCSSAKRIMREYMEMAKVRNSQAHAGSSLHEAERLRTWFMKNLHKIFDIFPITDEDVKYIFR